MNAMAVLAAADTLDIDAVEMGKNLHDFNNLLGRGAVCSGLFNGHNITLIDDSYNAGPASMKAAFGSLSNRPADVMVLSDMLELGDGTDAAHTALGPAIIALRPRILITIGSAMARMASVLPAGITHREASSPEDATALLASMIRDGDTVFIKGSNGSGAWRVAAELLSSFESSQPAAAGRQTMLPDLLVPLAGDYQIFNLFRYITFRTGGATITALVLSLMLGPMMIRWLKSHQAEGQPIRADGPESHIVTKAGTPTMGGILILGAFALSTLLWMPLSNPYLMPVLAVALAFGAVGSVDDWMKLRRRSHHGMSGRMKMALQLAVAFFVTLVFVELSPEQLRYGVAVPFLKDFFILAFFMCRLPCWSLSAPQTPSI